MKMRGSVCGVRMTLALMAACVGFAAEAAEIRGVVQHSETGDGLEGIEVLLLDAETSGRDWLETAPREETDADGAFVFPDLEPGNYSVVPETPPGYVRSKDDGPMWAELASGGSFQGTIVLEPAGFVAGRVADEEGVPQPDAAVSLLFEEYRFAYRVVKTDVEGFFRTENVPYEEPFHIQARTAAAISAPEGPFELEYEDDAPGAEDDGKDLGVFVVRPGAKVSGTLVDHAGEPLPDAPVRSRAEESLPMRVTSAISDEDGAFTLEGVGPGQIQIHTPIHAIPMELEREEEVSGVIIAGEPEDLGPLEEDGMFRYQPIGREAVLASFRDYAGLAPFSRVRPGVDEYRELGAEILEGVVLDQVRMPVEDARVAIKDTPLWTETDEDGRFALASLPEDPVTVIASHRRYPEKERPGVEPGTTDLEIVLPAAQHIEGRIVDAETGEPIRNFEIAGLTLRDVHRISFPPEEAPSGEERMSMKDVPWENVFDPRGRFSVPALRDTRIPSHRMTLVARAPGYSLGGVDAYMDPDLPEHVDGYAPFRDEEPVTIELEPSHTLHLEVVDAAENPFPGVGFSIAPADWDALDDGVRYFLSAHIQQQAPTDPEGRAEVSRLPSFMTQLSLHTEDRQRRREHIEYGPDRTAHVRVQFTEGATVVGRVLGLGYETEDRTPPQHALVSSNGQYATVDDTGRFRLENLSPGRTRIRLDLSQTGFEPRTTQYVDLQAGEATEVVFDFRKEATATVKGVVTYEGEPFQDGIVTLLAGEDGSHREGYGLSQNYHRDDPSYQPGHFEFDGVPPGMVTLIVGTRPEDDIPTGWSPPFAVSPGETREIALELSDFWGHARVRLSTTGSRRDFTQWTVFFEGPGPAAPADEAAAQVLLEEEALFIHRGATPFRGFHPGNYTVWIAMKGEPGHSAPRTLAEGELVTKQFTVPDDEDEVELEIDVSDAVSRLR